MNLYNIKPTMKIKIELPEIIRCSLELGELALSPTTVKLNNWPLV